MMKKQVVFVGAGHAHLYCLTNLRRIQSLGAETTVISPNEHHYYSGMGPGLLSGIYSPAECRFFVEKMAKQNNARFIKEKVIKVNPENNQLILNSGKEIFYDVVSFNVGSEIDKSTIDELKGEVIPIKPIENLLLARQTILKLNSKNLKRFYIIGGGAAGVEVAGNLWRLLASTKLNAEINIVSTENILSQYPKKVRSCALKSLLQRGIKVYERTKVERIDGSKLSLKDTTNLEQDFVFLATGIQPTNIFSDSGLPLAEDSSFLVNSHLQSLMYDNIFGGGDCISLKNKPLKKIGVYAVRQNRILFNNICKLLSHGDLEEFKPQKKYLLILNLGNGKGIAWRGNRTLYGKFPFLLKNYIDKRFMKKFQISEN